MFMRLNGSEDEWLSDCGQKTMRVWLWGLGIEV